MSGELSEGKRKATELVVYSGPSKRQCVSSSTEVQPRAAAHHRQRKSFLALDAYTRHKMLINEYRLSYPGATSKLVRDTSRDKTDLDVLKEHHRFLWEEEDEEAADGDSWGKRLAKKYYDKLFKEYGICDLSKYKENKIAMRWRTEKEVVEGKGQFSCGEKRCDETRDLRSWEVNFGYVEEGAKKNALVKMRLCPHCSNQLNYHQKRKEVRKKSKTDRNSAPGEEEGDESFRQKSIKGESSRSSQRSRDGDWTDEESQNECLASLLA